MIGCSIAVGLWRIADVRRLGGVRESFGHTDVIVLSHILICESGVVAAIPRFMWPAK